MGYSESILVFEHLIYKKSIKMNKIMCTLFLLLLICTVTECWWGSSSSRSRSNSRRTSTYTVNRGPRPRITTRIYRPSSINLVVKKGPFGGIRDRDETGHRTGLGTIARSFVRQPIKTVKSFGAFASSYNNMRNRIGGNLPAHEKANFDATKIGGARLSGGISALREQHKRFRIKQNPDKSVRIGDTRTPKEIRDTMNANKAGRDRARIDGYSG